MGRGDSQASKKGEGGRGIRIRKGSQGFSRVEEEQKTFN